MLRRSRASARVVSALIEKYWFWKESNNILWWVVTASIYQHHQKTFIKTELKMPVQIFLNDPLKLETLSDEIVAAWPNQPFCVSDHSSYCEGMKIRGERMLFCYLSEEKIFAEQTERDKRISSVEWMLFVPVVHWPPSLRFLRF